MDVFSNFLNFLNSNSNALNKDGIHCDDVCLDWSINIVDEEGNKVRPSCFSDPIPFIPSINSDEEYPEYQNSYCNGKVEGNEHNLCKPCCRYIKGSNSDGLSNVIILPFPTILNTVTGEYEDFGEILATNSSMYNEKNLMYDPNNKKAFNTIIFRIAFLICKQILYNGGPTSFPSDTISAGGVQKKCKIISLTEQNTFVFEINELKANINKII